MELIVELLTRWGWFLLSALSSISLVISDYKTGEYHGFKQTKIMVLIPALIAAGYLFAWQRGETGSDIVVTMVVGSVMLYVIPRIHAEILFRVRFGVWLCGSARRRETQILKSG